MKSFSWIATSSEYSNRTSFKIPQLHKGYHSLTMVFIKRMKICWEVYWVTVFGDARDLAPLILFSRIRTSLNIGKLKHSDYIIPEVETWVVPLKKGISSHSTTHLTSPFFGDGRGNSKWEYYAATAVARPSTLVLSPPILFFRLYVTQLFAAI